MPGSKAHIVRVVGAVVAVLGVLFALRFAPSPYIEPELGARNLAFDQIAQLDASSHETLQLQLATDATTPASARVILTSETGHRREVLTTRDVATPIVLPRGRYAVHVDQPRLLACAPMFIDVGPPDRSTNTEQTSTFLRCVDGGVASLSVVDEMQEPWNGVVKLTFLDALVPNTFVDVRNGRLDELVIPSGRVSLNLPHPNPAYQLKLEPPTDSISIAKGNTCTQIRADCPRGAGRNSVAVIRFVGDHAMLRDGHLGRLKLNWNNHFQTLWSWIHDEDATTAVFEDRGLVLNRSQFEAVLECFGTHFEPIRSPIRNPGPRSNVMTAIVPVVAYKNRIAGHVMDSRGYPFGGLSFQLRFPESGFVQDHVRTVVCDEVGNFEVVHVPPFPVLIELKGPISDGFKLVFRRGSQESVDRSNCDDISLWATGSRSVRLVDSDRALSAAPSLAETVWLHVQPIERVKRSPHTVQRGSLAIELDLAKDFMKSGEVDLGDLASGRYRYFIGSPSSGFASGEFTVPPEGDHRSEFKFRSASEPLVGRLDVSGLGFEGDAYVVDGEVPFCLAYSVARTMKAYGWEFKSARQLRDGAFRLEHSNEHADVVSLVMPGLGVVPIRKKRFLSEPVVKIDPGEVSTIEGVVRGSSTTDFAGLAVLLTSLQGGERDGFGYAPRLSDIQTFQVSKSGTFRILGAKAGEYVASVLPLDEAVAAAEFMRRVRCDARSQRVVSIGKGTTRLELELPPPLTR